MQSRDVVPGVPGAQDSGASKKNNVMSFNEVIERELKKIDKCLTQNKPFHPSFLVIPVEMRLTVALDLLQELKDLHSQNRVFVQMRPIYTFVDLESDYEKLKAIHFTNHPENKRFIKQIGKTRKNRNGEVVTISEENKGDNVAQMGKWMQMLLLGRANILKNIWETSVYKRLVKFVADMTEGKINAAQSYDQLNAVYSDREDLITVADLVDRDDIDIYSAPSTAVIQTNLLIGRVQNKSPETSSTDVSTKSWEGPRVEAKKASTDRSHSTFFLAVLPRPNRSHSAPESKQQEAPNTLSLKL